MNTQERRKSTYDKKHMERSYEPGELVAVWTPIRKIGKCEKLLRKYFGPYRILKKMSSVNHLIEPKYNPGQDHLVVHVSRLKHYYERIDEVCQAIGRSNLSQRVNSSRVQHAYRLRETRGQNIRRLRAQSARQAAVRSLETPDPIHFRLQVHSEIYSSTRRNTRTNNFFSSVWSSMENAGFNYSVAVEYFKHPLISLGMMDTTCRFCGALRWKDEFSGMCCSNGTEPLRSLLSGENSDSVHFLRNIRKYNSCFKMTSFGTENQTHSVTFPTTFSIQGQVYHRIGSLMPSENQPSRFLQIYFMGDDDDDIQTDRRCQ
ncbi:hypothetical protein LAZ67_14002000 [Cordylochernes scorpioides]|uniref:Integrase p58-like C-terminal domain-containing protein n=1 Tax=Cordylochernes scorpioides TaxID=51811 RepID=A0ABY6L7E7_9ARAC|nr:hypothetical protein LAZ67_14002000 [Cordylochernes scorpioides]